MANTYPYVASPGPLTGTIDQLRKSFPNVVNAETLQKLGLAPKNESYVLNVLRFLNLIDEEGKKAEAAKVFNKHDDEFRKGLEELVRKAYAGLFELHPNAWELERHMLVSFFRTEDDSSDTVGSRQAGTFETLAALCGHRTAPLTAPKSAKSAAKSVKRAPKKAEGANAPPQLQKTQGGPNVGLTVRVEVNLPATNDQTVYDSIFRSIRENLINVS